ncbi:probable inactive tRNA-specific adenosine deaminase-like protein 3 [Melopsittacus undulatus]|uniref:probable inactive tRNA-specific adenosine deaminase-like protein 3 n=1 Tax=Melopsittacus undulatus TaxID=13146 RepID=UPI00146B05B7|nr:probable inactive tRNA-specific adenosine deaminase-like protein 3 [Melopsittacus undulatus]
MRLHTGPYWHKLVQTGDGAADDVTAATTPDPSGDVTKAPSAITKGTDDVTNDVTEGPSMATKDTDDVTDAARDNPVNDVTADVTRANPVNDVTRDNPINDVTADVTASPLPPLRVLLGPSVSPLGLGSPFRVLVPGRAPHPGPETEAALAMGLWPWVLRGGSPPADPPPLQPMEAAAVAGAMAAAVAAALSGVRSGMEPSGAAVMDPGTGEVVAAAGDGRRGGHPLSHATMRCLEEVARRRRGYGGYGGINRDNGDTMGYLCQGWDVVLTREPCALCAMALVLARARRVLFGAPAPQGALSTRYGLHGRSRLNHRYRAYGGVAPKVWAPLVGDGVEK